MQQDEIDHIVSCIMYLDCPNRLTDGHEVITSFIMALLQGTGQQWKEQYLAKKGIPEGLL